MAMTTREIERQQWTDFFKGFTVDHEGQSVVMEVLDPRFGDQVEARDLKFEGIAADLHDGGDDAINVMLGEEADQHITHTIREPVHVRVAVPDESESVDEVLQIQSARDPTTLVCFRFPHH